MARPTPFDRQTSFAQFSSQFPQKPQNGASLDAEFNAAKVAIDETQANLSLIQDDDGELARGCVGRAQLDSSITLGFESPETWQPATAYTADLSTVFREAKFYRAIETHVSASVFDASKWEEIADLSASAAIDDGSITDAKLADGAVVSEKLGPLAVTTPKIATGAITNPKLADGAVTISKIDPAAAAAIAALIIPAGFGPVPWALSGDAPEGWVFANNTYLRADYPALAARAVADAANSSSWFTAGDGSTTFTIKSADGRALVGADPFASVLGTAVGTGTQFGSRKTNLTQAQLPTVNFNVNIPAGQGSHDHDGTVTGGASDNYNGGSNFSVVRSLTSGRTNPATLPAMSGTAASGGSAADISLIQPSMAVRFMFKAH